MVTSDPGVPLGGVMPVTTGAPVPWRTVKEPLLTNVPLEVVTEMGPEFDPLGTVTVIWPSELTVKGALAPARLTDKASVNPEPLTVTLLFPIPKVGLKLTISGAGGPELTVKELAEDTHPTEF